jgi:hypothetical protein
MKLGLFLGLFATVFFSRMAISASNESDVVAETYMSHPGNCESYELVEGKCTTEHPGTDRAYCSCP